MLMILQDFDLRVAYKPGKYLHIADRFSRAHLQEQTEQLLEEELEVNLLSARLPISEEKLNQFKTATAEDLELQQVMTAVQLGWLVQVSQVPAEIKTYWTSF